MDNIGSWENFIFNNTTLQMNLSPDTETYCLFFISPRTVPIQCTYCEIVLNKVTVSLTISNPYSQRNDLHLNASLTIKCTATFSFKYYRTVRHFKNAFRSMHFRTPRYAVSIYQSFGSGSVSGSGSAWIRINLSCWIRIRIRIQIADPDPGGQKLPKKVQNFYVLKCWMFSFEG
jgi:hypothetical protein